MFTLWFSELSNNLTGTRREYVRWELFAISTRRHQQTHLFTLLHHGCFKHSAAVARFVGSYSSIGFKNDENSSACSILHSYFSVRTSTSAQGLRPVMFLSSPRLLNRWCESRPAIAISFGIGPSSSMMWAKWSSSWRWGKSSVEVISFKLIYSTHPIIVLSCVRLKKVVASGEFKCHAGSAPDVGRRIIASTDNDFERAVLSCLNICVWKDGKFDQLISSRIS